MSQKLEYGKFYHIFNRGNNKEIIFHENADYKHFLVLYSTYIRPVTDTLSWCLMNNHFHFCVRIKEKEEIGYLNPDDLLNNKSKKWKVKYDLNLSNCSKPTPSRQFAHLFNAYSKWFNFQYSRSGSLFEKNFERKEICNDSYLADLIVYINANSVKHKVNDLAENYHWSSAIGIILGEDAICNLPLVWNYFENAENFKHLINNSKWSVENWKDVE